MIGPSKWLPAIAAVVVYPAWIWLAVRTRQCLRAITRNTIPFTKRTVWLAKILGLIVGAGGAFRVAFDLGMPWFLALLPAGTIVAFAAADSVEEVVPPKPMQDSSAYQSSWLEYRRLRWVYKKSWLGFAAAFSLLVLVSFMGEKLPPTAQVALSIMCLAAVFCSIAVISFNQWKWFTWPCPRCGRSFRGLWNRIWLPKTCAYCGLPREDERESHGGFPSDSNLSA
jgi:hypothetical protein